MWITGILCANAVKNQPPEICCPKISEKSKNGKISKNIQNVLLKADNRGI